MSNNSKKYIRKKAGSLADPASPSYWSITTRSVFGPLLFLINNSDINYEIADSTVSCFADDARILLGIKDGEDTQIVQNDLHKLYKWADTNNMKFNAKKFELPRYGKELEIKSATTYKSYDD